MHAATANELVVLNLPNKLNIMNSNVVATHKSNQFPFTLAGNISRVSCGRKSQGADNGMC